MAMAGRMIGAHRSRLAQPNQTLKENIMKVCFPVQKDDGVESQVYNHFGSAPVFIVIDTEAKGVQRLNNQDLGHVHGACNPLQALGGQKIDALVAGGIGGGAVTKLNAMGVKIYRAHAQTVRENLVSLKDGKLKEISMNDACQAHEGGCGH
jgi:predicted Fe-Mo cluster-binding NifX family protein